MQWLSPASFTQLDPRDEAAEILVAQPILGQQGVAASFRGGDLRADQSADAGLFARHVETRRAIDALRIR
jgi:hypothetical protein